MGRLACISHRLPTADADLSKKTVPVLVEFATRTPTPVCARRKQACSTYCQVRLRAFRSAPHCARRPVFHSSRRPRYDNRRDMQAGATQAAVGW